LNVAVAVNAYLDDEILASATVYMLSYALPTLLSLGHEQCSHGNENDTFSIGSDQFITSGLADCPREGGGILTLHGYNFGEQGAEVFVGSNICTNLQHFGHSEVQCELPQGTTVSTGVMLIQYGGEYSLNQLKLGYAQCVPGTYQVDSDTNCSLCEPGHITANEGQFTCTPCSAGTISSASQDECLDCPGGKYSLSGSSHCLECLQGTYTSDSTTKFSCIPCERGSYQPLNGSTSCTLCPTGQVQAYTGQDRCVNCSIGRYSSDEGNVDCVTCEAGRTQSNGGQSFCENCEFGKFKTTSSTEDCMNCTSGSYTSSGTTLFVCAACSAGYFQALNGSTSCHQCSSGKYQNMLGSSNCLNCTSGRYSGTDGSVTCQECEKGKYQAEYGLMECDVCPTGHCISPLSLKVLGILEYLRLTGHPKCIMLMCYF